MIDVTFISPNSAKKSYQSLSIKHSAIEPPTWALLLAESCRSVGFKVGIIDMLAEDLSDEALVERINLIKPRLICFVVYGQNVNAGTTNMSSVVSTCTFLKNNKIEIPISIIGSHVQALPKATLEKEKCIDFVFMNEGVYALRNVLKLHKINETNLYSIKGICFRNKENNIIINQNETIVPKEKMDKDLPGYAWDLLPYDQIPLDLYRSPLWHAGYVDENRTPYAAIQTSLGCQFKCSFCMINLINKTNNDELGVANEYSSMRFWTPEFVIKQFDKLIELGVKTIKITDEMFLLNPKYYLPLCDYLAERNKDDKLNFWAYSRIDTVKDKSILNKVRRAGIRWLCLGIESGSKSIRLEVSKGKFEDVKIDEVVKHIESCDINVMANYIYGLPGDTKDTINDTFELSKKLNTAGWNTYAAMALPGSELYKNSLSNNCELPKKYEEFSFLGYETLPLSNENLHGAEILQLRDKHFKEYFENKNFLEKIKSKFGENAVKNIKDMCKLNLKRKIIEDFEKKNYLR